VNENSITSAFVGWVKFTKLNIRSTLSFTLFHPTDTSDLIGSP